MQSVSARDARAHEKQARGRSRWFVIALVVVLLGVVTISLTTNLRRQSMANAQADAAAAKPAMPGTLGAVAKTESLEIVAGDTRHIFRVEVARSESERAKGLMFRTNLPEDSGMLFDFGADQIITMWMKNTPLSLDMVFIDAQGRIHRIESRTEPYSERVISSGVPVRAVLEIRGGEAEKRGLKPGQRVKHAMFP